MLRATVPVGAVTLGASFLIGVGTQMSSVGKSCALPPAPSEAAHRTWVNPLWACVPRHPPGPFHEPVELSASDWRQHKPAADCPEQTPLRGSCPPAAPPALCKTQVGSYFHMTFVRLEPNCLHPSYLNLQKELVGSGQRVKNAFTYLGALLYATATAACLGWKG